MAELAVKSDQPAVRRARGRPTARESEALYASIVSAAIREFETYGFELGSVNDIAARAGVTKATIYRLFGSKEQLFKVAIRKALKSAETPAREFDSSGDPEVVLRDAAGRISHSYLSGTVGALWHSVLAVKKRFPDFHDEILAVLRRESIASSLAEYLGALHRRGVLHIPDPLLTAHHFSLLVGQGRELALPPKASAEQERNRIEQIIAMFIKGHRYRAEPAHLTNDVTERQQRPAPAARRFPGEG